MCPTLTNVLANGKRICIGLVSVRLSRRAYTQSDSPGGSTDAVSVCLGLAARRADAVLFLEI